MKTSVFFLGLTLLLARSGVPQTPAPPTKPFFFKHFTTKNGLSYNLINCLFEDREGYVWVGTFNGLNRFDGTRFVSFKYDRNDPHSVAHNNITDLCEDRAGNIWVATFYGVSRYVKAQNTFVNYLLEPQSKDVFRDNVVNNILCDRNGTV
ncbi:MAG: hypothetical protein H7Y12_12805, partial [Sphingobacteriaceae bacterium]|nr:hypothetical protein [Cytophagaceae bacterium]